MTSSWRNSRRTTTFAVAAILLGLLCGVDRQDLLDRLSVGSRHDARTTQAGVNLPQADEGMLQADDVDKLQADVVIRQAQPEYTCPHPRDYLDHHYNSDEDADYKAEIAQNSNLTYLAENYTNVKYDLWTMTYEKMKIRINDWKKEQFAVVNSGDAIYESALGIGFNLLMTTEIIQEYYPEVQNLTLSGNEYRPSAVDIAQGLLDHGVFPPNVNTAGGRLCTGDSTNLTHVPSASFDIVYTGYISPLHDPLGVGNGHGDDWVRKSYKLCRGHPDQVRLMKNRQEAWYNAWVKEMVRICKPGGKIMVEEVSRPVCQIGIQDFGGVDPSFWKRGIAKRWKTMNATSLVIKDSHVLHYGRRYHVAMTKNKE